ncbi:acyl-CoA dehydrogenase family protein [Pseudonocardia sp. NPDC049154]|uniref:acyl-CoA dehydrogenase family protein n=1 Tax=Pseudonocardia sp. NPDC049154 TaxID=3155501 RepID=UPI0033E02D8C
MSIMEVAVTPDSPFATATPLRETAEQRDLRSTVRRFLADTADLPRVRERMLQESPHDPEVWKRLAEDLGLVGLAVPERWGGLSASFADQVIVLEEQGRALYGGAYLSSAVLAPAALLAVSDDAARDRHLPGIASGETLATVVGTSAEGEWSRLDVAASRTAAGWSLTGTASHVPDGSIAELLLVVAATSVGPSVFAVRSGAGVAAEPLPALDQTRGLAVVRLQEAEGELLGAVGEGTAVLAEVLDRAAVAVAAEQLGGSANCLERSVEYLKAREQFGGPIGRFQALKHLCADMYVGVEASRAVVMYAARAFDEDLPDRGAAAAMARSWCSDAYVAAASDTLQMHGGIGYTWESDVHLYFKRATASALWWGDADASRERLASLLLDTGPTGTESHA